MSGLQEGDAITIKAHGKVSPVALRAHVVRFFASNGYHRHFAASECANQNWSAYDAAYALDAEGKTWIHGHDEAAIRAFAAQLLLLAGEE